MLNGLIKLNLILYSLPLDLPPAEFELQKADNFAEKKTFQFKRSSDDCLNRLTQNRITVSLNYLMINGDQKRKRKENYDKITGLYSGISRMFAHSIQGK